MSCIHTPALRRKKIYSTFYVTNIKADSRLAPSQWETSLQSNAVSHCMEATLESALNMMYFLFRLMQKYLYPTTVICRYPHIPGLFLDRLFLYETIMKASNRIMITVKFSYVSALSPNRDNANFPRSKWRISWWMTRTVIRLWNLTAST